mgnify:CR=1 FL=1
MTDYEARLYRSEVYNISEELEHLRKKEGKQKWGVYLSDKDSQALATLEGQLKPDPIRLLLLLNENTGTFNWDMNYELKTAKVIGDEEFVTEIGRLSFSSERTIEDFAKNYVRKYPNKTVKTRVGTIIVCPPQQEQFQIIAMQKEFSS